MSNSVFVFIGDEMFSDTYKMKLIDGVLYEVYGKVSYILQPVHELITDIVI